MERNRDSPTKLSHGYITTHTHSHVLIGIAKQFRLACEMASESVLVSFLLSVCPFSSCVCVEKRCVVCSNDRHDTARSDIQCSTAFSRSLSHLLSSCGLWAGYRAVVGRWSGEARAMLGRRISVKRRHNKREVVV